MGGVNGRWELLPLGAPMGEVAFAESRAPPGGVAVAASAWKHLAPAAQGVGMGEAGLVALTTAPPAVQRIAQPERRSLLPDAALAPYVPAPVRGWNGATGSDWLAELRPVSTVMVCIPGQQGVFADDLQRAQTAVRILQQTMVRFEGASKPGMDNKGLMLSGVFGVSPRAHADDRERALRAAAAMTEQLRGAGLEPSTGRGQRTRVLRAVRKRPAPRVHDLRQRDEPGRHGSPTRRAEASSATRRHPATSTSATASSHEAHWR